MTHLQERPINNARIRAERYLVECNEYTDVHEHERLVCDWENKDKVASSVVKDFERRAGNLEGRRLLDIGFGNGTFAIAFARSGAIVSGIEVNETLYRIARELSNEEKVHLDLHVYDGGGFPFADDYFDYEYSTSVLEHVSDPKVFLTEAYRVLKPGGKLYLSFPNRWRPLETHTHVFFLSYLPRSIAQLILRRFFNRNTLEELNLHFLSFWDLKNMLRTVPFRIVEEPKVGGIKGFVKELLWRLGLHHSILLGTIMVILEK